MVFLNGHPLNVDRTTSFEPGTPENPEVPSWGPNGTAAFYQGMSLAVTRMLYVCQNQNGLQATFRFEMCFCYRIPAPVVPGVPTKTRLESSIKNSPLFSVVAVR